MGELPTDGRKKDQPPPPKRQDSATDAAFDKAVREQLSVPGKSGVGKAKSPETQVRPSDKPAESKGHDSRADDSAFDKAVREELNFQKPRRDRVADRPRSAKLAEGSKTPPDSYSRRQRGDQADKPLGEASLELQKKQPSREKTSTYKPEVNVPQSRAYEFQFDRGRRVISHRVDGFDIGSAEMSSEMKGKLDQIIEEFGSTNEKTSQIDIIGFASRSHEPGKGGLEYAWKRAEAVQEYFASKGITWARANSIGDELGPSKFSGPQEKSEHRGVFINIKLMGDPMETIGEQRLHLPEPPERPSPKDILTPPLGPEDAIKKVAKNMYQFAVEAGYANRAGTAKMLLNYQNRGFASAMADLTDWNWQKGEDEPRQVEAFNNKTKELSTKTRWPMDKLLNEASRNNIREVSLIPDAAYERGQRDAYDAVKKMTSMGYEQFCLDLQKKYPSHEMREKAIKEHLQMLTRQEQNYLDQKAEKQQYGTAPPFVKEILKKGVKEAFKDVRRRVTYILQGD